jgi:hypothetical protein
MDAESNGLAQRRAVKSALDARFGAHGLRLPTAAVTYALPGWLRAAGWQAAFRWVRSNGDWSLELDADHRKTDPTHIRIAAGGETDELDAVHDFAQPPIEREVEAALLQIGNYNVAIRTVLERRGLHPWPRLEQRALRAEARNFDPETIFSRAAEVAAGAVDPLKPKASFLERKLEDGVRAGLEREIEAARIGARSTKHHVPGWTDHLGGLDLFVEDERRPRDSSRAEDRCCGMDPLGPTQAREPL